MYGENFYFVSMRSQKPGANYYPSVIVPEDSEVSRFGVFLSHGVRSAGFNGAIKSASTLTPDLTTDDWVGVDDPPYTFTLIRFRRGGPGATTEEINTPGPRYLATNENGWEAPNQEEIGEVTLSAPTSADTEWDPLAWTLGTDGTWAAHGGGHRDSAWASATGDPRVQRGDCVKFVKTDPSGYPATLFDNISGNPANDGAAVDYTGATARNYHPWTRLPINYHAGGTTIGTDYVHSPTGIQLASADAGSVKNVPSTMNQWRKAREGGVSIVFERT